MVRKDFGAKRKKPLKAFFIFLNFFLPASLRIQAREKEPTNKNPPPPISLLFFSSKKEKRKKKQSTNRCLKSSSSPFRIPLAAKLESFINSTTPFSPSSPLLSLVTPPKLKPEPFPGQFLCQSQRRSSAIVELRRFVPSLAGARFPLPQPCRSAQGGKRLQAAPQNQQANPKKKKLKSPG